MSETRFEFTARCKTCDGPVAHKSDVFQLVKFEGEGFSGFDVPLHEAENFARWLLDIHPYGKRTIHA